MVGKSSILRAFNYIPGIRAIQIGTRCALSFSSFSCQPNEKKQHHQYYHKNGWYKPSQMVGRWLKLLQDPMISPFLCAPDIYVFHTQSSRRVFEVMFIPNMGKQKDSGEPGFCSWCMVAVWEACRWPKLFKSFPRSHQIRVSGQRAMVQGVSLW